MPAGCEAYIVGSLAVVVDAAGRLVEVAAIQNSVVRYTLVDAERAAIEQRRLVARRARRAAARAAKPAQTTEQRSRRSRLVVALAIANNMDRARAALAQRMTARRQGRIASVSGRRQRAA